MGLRTRGRLITAAVALVAAAAVWWIAASLHRAGFRAADGARTNSNGLLAAPSQSLQAPAEQATQILPDAASASPGASPEGPIVLRDVTAETGISFIHRDGGSGKRYIVETVTAGLALFDYDGDGLIDIYFLTGTPLQGTKADSLPINRLYRNLGGFRFVDVTNSAGVGPAGYGLGVCVGDYDNDGQPDLYVSNFGPNVLYRNRGDGTFQDVTQQAGVGRGSRVGAGASFLDFDADGQLDLFAANYVVFSYDRPATRYFGGYLRYPGPRDFPPERNSLFRNLGNGAFEDVSVVSGVASVAGTGMGIVACDYDNDGDTDVFVCNDLGANFLYRNEGGGKFQEVGLAAGVAYNFEAAPTASMGPDCADYDHDGWLDIFLTDYQGEWPCLYKNLRDGTFEDVTVQAGAGAGTFPYIKWGCGFADFDNDGHKDLFIATGHIEEFIDKLDPTTAYAPPNTVLRNTGDGRFVDVTKTAGDGLRVRASARGAAFDDLDGDGRIDVVVLNSNARPTVLRNVSQNANHWIQLQLRGVKTNRDGVGARVRLVAGDLAQTDEVHSGRGYQSHWGSRLHFGLGTRNRVDRIEIRWIGGGVDVFENVAADRVVTLTEGEGRAMP
jgi:hypothetical protein